jgi:hypothetical protein
MSWRIIVMLGAAAAVLFFIWLRTQSARDRSRVEPILSDRPILTGFTRRHVSRVRAAAIEKRDREPK